MNEDLLHLDSGTASINILFSCVAEYSIFITSFLSIQLELQQFFSLEASQLTFQRVIFKKKKKKKKGWKKRC